jgi:hypothetical protein
MPPLGIWRFLPEPHPNAEPFAVVDTQDEHQDDVDDRAQDGRYDRERIFGSGLTDILKLAGELCCVLLNFCLVTPTGPSTRTTCGSRRFIW